MAKIKINGDSSGYVEIAAPNAAHNNTLELGPGTKILTDKNTHCSNIGIGTDIPYANSGSNLHIHSANNTSEIRLTNSTTGGGNNGSYIQQGDNVLYIGNTENGNTVFETVGTKRLSINSDGSTSMHVNSASHDTFRFTTQGSNEAKLIMKDASSNDDIVLNTGGNSWFNGGNLGIGDASPTKPLTVGTTTPVILLDDQSSRTLEIRGPSTTHNATVLTTSTHDLLLGTNNAERLRITSAGRMGVGTNDPNALLEVRDSENTTQGNAQIRISKGVGAGAAPATITRANTYLHLGGTEWGSGANGQYLIGFGYTNDEVGTGIPAYIGFKEIATSGYTHGDLIFGTRDTTTGTDNATERMRIDKDGHIRFGSSGTGYDSAWSHSNYGNTEVAIDGDGGYGVLHFRGDGAGSVNTRFSMGVGDEIFYMCYDDVNARHNIMVDSSGRVRMPQQPAFDAVYDSGNGGTGYTSTNTEIVFNVTNNNRGNHYSTSTGRFTAPVTGTYFFSIGAMNNGTGGSATAWYELRVNGSFISNPHNPYTSVSDGGFRHVTSQYTLQLNGGDYVSVFTGTTTGGIYGGGNNHNHFVGYLIG